MCIFCEIIKGNIPSKKVYEDDKVLAILDISQITKGHTLVLPKKHFDNFLDIDDEYTNAVFTAAKKVTKMIIMLISLKALILLTIVEKLQDNL